MSQTEMLNAVLSRDIREGVGKHVSGNYSREGQLWATSSHRMSYDNAFKLLTEYGKASDDFAMSVLTMLIGLSAPTRVMFFMTVDEAAMQLHISTTVADTTAMGTINYEGLSLDIDADGIILSKELPASTLIRDHVGGFFVFYLPSIATILAKK